MTERVQGWYLPKIGRVEPFSVAGDPFEVCNEVAKRLGCRMLEADPVGDAILAERARWDENGIAVSEGGKVDARTTKARVTTSEARTEHLPARRLGVRATSLEAYQKAKFSGKLTAQQELVVAWLRGRIGDATRLEISRGSGIAINAVCGRVKELVDLGVLVEARKRRCRISGETANALEVAK